MTTRQFFGGILVLVIVLFFGWWFWPGDTTPVSGESGASAATSTEPVANESVFDTATSSPGVARTVPFSSQTANAAPVVRTTISFGAGAAIPPRKVTSGEKNVPVAHFVIQGATSVVHTLTAIALGSADANGTFNFLENMKLITVTGRTIGLTFQKRYLGPYPLYTLAEPLAIPVNSSTALTVLMDAKPSLVAGKSLSPVVVGGGMTEAGVVSGAVHGEELSTF